MFREQLLVLGCYPKDKSQRLLIVAEKKSYGARRKQIPRFARNDNPKKSEDNSERPAAKSQEPRAKS
jgi:hypothetical protein